MALSDFFNKAKNIINTAAEGANKIKDAIQQAASQTNEERPNAAHAESGSGASAVSQTAPTSRPATTPPKTAREIETLPTDGAPEITPEAFKAFLIAEGYKQYTDAGKPSTVYMYLDAVADVCKTEKMDLPKLATKIASIVKKYDKGGEKEKAGAKSHDTVINALKAFKDLVKKNKPKMAKEVKSQKTEKTTKAESGEVWEWAVTPKFRYANIFENSRAKVILMDRSTIHIDKNFQQVQVYETKDNKFKSNLKLIWKDPGGSYDLLYGFKDKNDNIVIKPQFMLAYPFEDHITTVQTYPEEKWGCIDEDGKWVFKPIYDCSIHFYNGIAKASVNNKYGFIDRKEKWVISPAYEDIHEEFYDGVVGVKLGDKWGYIDKKGNFLIKPKFNNVKNFSEGCAPVKLDGKWGYIDKKGNFIIKPQFNNAMIFNEGLAPVELDGKWGYIDKKGNFVIKPQFNKAIIFSEGLAPVELDGKWGYIRLKK